MLKITFAIQIQAMFILIIDTAHLMKVISRMAYCWFISEPIWKYLYM